MPSRCDASGVSPVGRLSCHASKKRSRGQSQSESIALHGSSRSLQGRAQSELPARTRHPNRARSDPKASKGSDVRTAVEAAPRASPWLLYRGCQRGMRRHAPLQGAPRRPLLLHGERQDRLMMSARAVRLGRTSARPRTGTRGRAPHAAQASCCWNSPDMRARACGEVKDGVGGCAMEDVCVLLRRAIVRAGAEQGQRLLVRGALRSSSKWAETSLDLEAGLGTLRGLSIVEPKPPYVTRA